MSDPEELTFSEFQTFLFSMGSLAREGTVIKRFYYYIKSGCTEAEAKRWLALHIWDFEPKLQQQLTLALAADALHEAAKQAEADSNAEQQVKKR